MFVLTGVGTRKLRQGVERWRGAELHAPSRRTFGFRRSAPGSLLWRTRFDVGWQYGSLAKSATPPEPEPEGADVAALLDSAEDIVNAAAPDILAEFDKKKNKGVFRRKAQGKGKGKGKRKR